MHGCRHHAPFLCPSVNPVVQLHRNLKLPLSLQATPSASHLAPCKHVVQVEFVLQAGESGLGKTTFIDNLRSAFQPDSPSSTSSPLALGSAADTYATFEHSPEQLCTEVTLENGSSKFHYFLQVTSLSVFSEFAVTRFVHAFLYSWLA